MAPSAAAERPTVLVCITCRRSMAEPLDAPRAGAALAAATIQAAHDAPDIEVRPIRCLANCCRGLSAAIRSPNAWTYIFGGLNDATDAQALIAGARMLAAASDGIMPWKGRPEPLKKGLIARVPPLAFQEDL